MRIKIHGLKTGIKTVLVHGLVQGTCCQVLADSFVYMPVLCLAPPAAILGKSIHLVTFPTQKRINHDAHILWELLPGQARIEVTEV